MIRIPPLCVGLPVYNGEAFLPQALESLVAQSFSDFEVVISDNCSTDGTADICRRFERLDRRIRFVRNAANIGAGPNFNRVFRYCRSPFFKWMAHDDMLAPDCLRRLMLALEADERVVLAHSRLKLVDEAGMPLPIGPDGRVVDRKGRPFHIIEPPHLAEGPNAADRFAEALRRMNWCTAIFGVIRTDALKRTHLHGSYYEADRVLLAELALLGRLQQLDEPLFLKRCHSGVSVLKPYPEQARMIDPAVWPGPRGLRLRLGYLAALAVGDLTIAERLACAVTVLRVSLRSRVSHRLLRWMRRQDIAPNPPPHTAKQPPADAA